MKDSVRFYSVGGVVFTVEMRAPWKFMKFYPEVEDRIGAAARGEVLPVQPVRAGDAVPSRSFVRSAKEILSEDLRCSIDFSQYEPFRISETADVSFRVTVGSLSGSLTSPGAAAELLWEFNDELPSYSVYRTHGGNVIMFYGAGGKVMGKVTGGGMSYSVLLPEPADGRYHYPLVLNSAVMMVFLMAVSDRHVLMVHSSVVSHRGEADMFFGESGTGKSTHSRLWLENIEGSELVNDDNPVIVLEDGVPYVYGTPWSGKTPCYRNVRRRIRSLVFLKQSQMNSIAPLEGLESLVRMLGSVSSPVWDPHISERISDDVAVLLNCVPVWLLECLPDAEAARVCQQAVE